MFGSDIRALGCGLLLGLSLFFSYRLVLIVPLAVIVLALHRRFRVIALAAVGLGIAVTVVGLLGLWWLEAFLEARTLVLQSVVSQPPYAYFIFANVGALLVALGPAIWVDLRTRLENELLLAAEPPSG